MKFSNNFFRIDLGKNAYLTKSSNKFDEEMELMINKWVDDGGKIEKSFDYNGDECWDAHTPDGRSTYTAYSPDELLKEMKSYYDMLEFVSKMIEKRNKD
jgi:hypothetical protein